MTQKSSDAFRTISEVAEHLDIPPHVLRFWETKFSTLRPLKRSGGRRYYRPDDVALLERIRDLLYKEGFTIKGAQKHLSNRQAGGPGGGIGMAGQIPASDRLSEALESLNVARKSLTALRGKLRG
ncbi:MAG: MerR family transcriptional regulator [Pseudomonadota bacterium]|nr:MerR family transcriptional regulator [Pseudomonadota bacterium]MEC7237329.1 MerR family transcriptional regulator [Pseudomonadota bacterium]